jgi:hypothetical protein
LQDCQTNKEVICTLTNFHFVKDQTMLLNEMQTKVSPWLLQMAKTKQAIMNLEQEFIQWETCPALRSALKIKCSSPELARFLCTHIQNTTVNLMDTKAGMNFQSPWHQVQATEWHSHFRQLAIMDAFEQERFVDPGTAWNTSGQGAASASSSQPSQGAQPSQCGQASHASQVFQGCNPLQGGQASHASQVSQGGNPVQCDQASQASHAPQESNPWQEGQASQTSQAAQGGLVQGGQAFQASHASQASHACASQAPSTIGSMKEASAWNVLVLPEQR